MKYPFQSTRAFLNFLEFTFSESFCSFLIATVRLDNLSLLFIPDIDLIIPL